MKALSRILIALVFVVMYAPLAVLILFSFNSSQSTGVFTGFSLQWYGELFSNPDAFIALRNTLILAASSAIIA